VNRKDKGYKDKSNIIGTIGFNNYDKRHRANLGYDLQPAYWGKGYMTEVLGTAYGYKEYPSSVNSLNAFDPGDS
jgi:ribosomal-protein-alanine N-acetyltransferase